MQSFNVDGRTIITKNREIIYILFTPSFNVDGRTIITYISYYCKVFKCKVSM